MGVSPPGGAAPHAHRPDRPSTAPTAPGGAPSARQGGQADKDEQGGQDVVAAARRLIEEYKAKAEVGVEKGAQPSGDKDGGVANDGFVHDDDTISEQTHL